MRKLADYLPQTILVAVDDQTATITDHVNVTINCACGSRTTMSTRTLYRNWRHKPAYLCKSCQVKTYARNPQKLAKFRTSFAKSAATTEHHQKCSAAAKKLWATPELRQRVTEAVRQDNIINPKKAAARATASEALMAKPWFKGHMDRIRVSAHKSLRDNLLACPSLAAILAANFRLNDPAIQTKHRRSTGIASRARWADPDYRAKMKAIINSPENLTQLSDKARIQWQSADYRAKMTALYATAEYQAKMSAISKEINARPAVREAKAHALATSKLEEAFATILDSMTINYIRQYFVGWYSFDFWLPDRGLLIEINGDWFHSKPNIISRDAAKATFIARYHADNYQLKTIWEREFGSPTRVRQIVANWCNTEQRQLQFNLRDVAVEIEKAAEETKTLIEHHHYIGKIGRYKLIVGCRVRDELIAAIALDYPTRQETASRLGMDFKSVLELTRFCIRQDCHKRNLASYILARLPAIVRSAFPTAGCLISFADTTFGHAGTIYKAANWAADGCSPASYYYRDPDGFVLHKKTLWNQATKMHLTERAYAERFGYVKVKTKPKHRYVYHL